MRIVPHNGPAPFPTPTERNLYPRRPMLGRKQNALKGPKGPRDSMRDPLLRPVIMKNTRAPSPSRALAALAASPERAAPSDTGCLACCKPCEWLCTHAIGQPALDWCRDLLACSSVCKKLPYP
jgi:hypothetical protein